MPARSLIFDLNCRNHTICRACLTNLRQQPSPTWHAAFSSQPARNAKTRPTPAARRAARRPEGNDLGDVLDKAKAAASGGGPAEPTTDFTVRYFEQDGDKRTALSSEAAFDQSLGGGGATHLKEGIRGMKDEFQDEDEKGVFEKVFNQIGPELDKAETEEDVERLLASLQSNSNSIDAGIERTMEELPKELADQLRKEMPDMFGDGEETRIEPRASPLPQISEKQWTPNQRKKINRLNTAMKNSSKEMHRGAGLSRKGVQAVYKAYHTARLGLAHSWSSVPLEVWDFLWQCFSAEEPVNVNRLSHISLLARDMSEAKVVFSPSQQLLTIEALFVDGWESKAIDNWKRCMSTLGDTSAETFKDFWELGVRMYCRTGDIAQAERAVSKLLERHMDPRILLPLIRVCSEQDSAASKERAWAAYRQMRELLRDDMTLSDYDEVVSSFLMTNQTEHALYAFVDMMSNGHIDLKQRQDMPAAVGNKFFLGKWLKRLIGAGDLDGAYSVVEFMRKKGVSAAAVHLNGLIGAWQRSGSAKDVEKADKLAWDMIEARIEFVKARKLRSLAALAKVASKSEIAPLPRATLETFCLLAENYRVRGLHSELEGLWTAFYDAEMKADAFMMNQLIESTIQTGQWKEALAMYNTFVGEKGVTPDPYTFSALWKTPGANRLHAIAPEAVNAEAAVTRTLFADTVKFKDVFMPDGMDGQLARKILHTFRRLQDHAGLLVALTALKDTFKFLPSDTLVLEMLLGTTKLTWETTPQRRRLMNVKRDMDRELEEWAEGDAKLLEGAGRGQALYEYLQKKYWPAPGAVEDERKFLIKVATEMGVYIQRGHQE